MYFPDGSGDLCGVAESAELTNVCPQHEASGFSGQDGHAGRQLAFGISNDGVQFTQHCCRQGVHGLVLPVQEKPENIVGIALKAPVHAVRKLILHVLIDLIAHDSPGIPRRLSIRVVWMDVGEDSSTFPKA